MVAPAPPSSAGSGLRRIWREGRTTPGFWRLVILSLVAACLNGAIILPLFMQQATAMLTGAFDMAQLVRLCLACFALLTMGYAAEWAASKNAAKVNRRICHRLVTRQVEGTIRSPLRAFERHGLAQYQSAIGDVTEVIQTHQLFMLQSAILSVGVSVLSITVLALYNGWFVAITLPFALVICGLPMLLAARADRYIAAEPDAFAGLGGFLETTVAGRHEWQFAPARNLLAEADRLAAQVHRAQTGKWWIWNLSFNLKLTLNLVLNAVTLLVAGLLYLDGAISLGTAVGGFLMVTMVAPRFDNLYKLFNFAQASGAAYAALDQLLLEPAPGTPAVPRARVEAVRLEVSGFSHAGSTDIAIRSATLDLRPGDRCLITGASGAGKSTLVDLLLGLRQSPAARLTINGEDVARFGLDRYWSDIAYVANPDLVLDELTAEENLALFGNRVAADLPGSAAALGWETFWATAGGRLSGGERQRLTILRALSRKCCLIVLDEPTSALDAANAAAVFRLLADLRDAIVIVVSHDQQVGPQFTHRYVLSDGMLQECP